MQYISIWEVKAIIRYGFIAFIKFISFVTKIAFFGLSISNRTVLFNLGGRYPIYRVDHMYIGVLIGRQR